MQKMNIDYLCLAPHKGLYAPMGIGALIAKKPINKTIIEGGTGNNSAELLQGKEPPEDFESGTINLPAVCGFSAGLDFVNKRSTDKIYRHEARLPVFLSYIVPPFFRVCLLTAAHPSLKKTARFPGAFSPCLFKKKILLCIIVLYNLVNKLSIYIHTYYMLFYANYSRNPLSIL